jgi:hypothetical protein
MILKIILGIVLVKILIDFLWTKEGYSEDYDIALNNTGDKAIVEKCSINIKLPNYDAVKNVYNNDNDYIFNNYQNIKRAANPDVC